MFKRVNHEEALHHKINDALLKVKSKLENQDLEKRATWAFILRSLKAMNDLVDEEDFSAEAKKKVNMGDAIRTLLAENTQDHTAQLICEVDQLFQENEFLALTDEGRQAALASIGRK